MTSSSSFAELSDDDLLAAVKRLTNCERQATTQLIACLMEVDARRLYLGEGCSSLFTYCMQVLHLSEHAAYGRIEAARAARRFPRILALLADGDLTLTAVCLLAPHLTADNHEAVLDEARYKSKREVEQLVAALHPRPDVRTSVRKLPGPTPAARRPNALPADMIDLTASTEPSEPPLPPSPPATSPPVVVPLAPERYKVQVTVSRQTYEKLRRAQDLLRHSIPDGDPAAIVDRALTLLVAELERVKLAATDRPHRAPAARSEQSRHIPATVKRAVWARDAGRCAFVGRNGRCRETGFLEFHHVVPYARGGPPSVDNIELRCAAHNAYESALCFGWTQDHLLEAGV
jgi:hypothetical protein